MQKRKIDFMRMIFHYCVTLYALNILFQYIHVGLHIEPSHPVNMETVIDTLKVESHWDDNVKMYISCLFVIMIQKRNTVTFFMLLSD